MLHTIGKINKNVRLRIYINTKNVSTLNNTDKIMVSPILEVLKIKKIGLGELIQATQFKGSICAKLIIKNQQEKNLFFKFTFILFTR